MVLLALLQRLIEAVAQGQVRLSLGALDKALNLPGTGTSLVLLLLLLTILRLLLILLRGLLVLLRRLLRTATPSHHPSNGTASHMTNGTTDGDTTSSCCHLLHQAWLLGLGHCRWRSSHWCRRRGRSCPWSR